MTDSTTNEKSDDDDELKAVTNEKPHGQEGVWLPDRSTAADGVKEQRMMGYLQVASDEPDLVSAADHAGVLVHGNHVGVAAELTGHAHYLPQQADLVADRLLRGRPKEGSDNQSESSVS